MKLEWIEDGHEYAAEWQVEDDGHTATIVNAKYTKDGEEISLEEIRKSYFRILNGVSK